MAKAKKKKALRGRPRRSVQRGSVLGLLLRQLRESKPIGVYDLAARSGVSRVTIYDIEAGAVDPTAETLKKLDGVLGGTRLLDRWLELLS